MDKSFKLIGILLVFGLVSCSHDEEIDMSIGEAETPVIFDVAVEDVFTRASVLKVKDFTSYSVYVLNSVTSSRIAKNTLYNWDDASESWIQTGTLNWPVNGNPLTFYAANASLEKKTATKDPGPFDKLTISSTKQTLTYTVPDDAKKQHDLMVASAFKRTKDQDNGRVKLVFAHTLAFFNFKIMNGMGSDYTVKIGGISIHNMLNSGTFTYDKKLESKGAWANGITRGKAERVFDGPFEISTSYNYLVDKDTVFMVMPQAKTTKWKTTKTNNIPTSVADVNGHTYLKLLCKIQDKDGNYIFGSPTEYGDVYLPFNAKKSVMAQFYTYDILFAGGYDIDGVPLSFGSDFSIELEDWTDETDTPIEVEF